MPNSTAARRCGECWASRKFRERDGSEIQGLGHAQPSPGFQSIRDNGETGSQPEGPSEVQIGTDLGWSVK